MIDAPGTVNWGASGINGSGSIVGTYNLTASPGTHHGFFDVGGNFTLIDAPGGIDGTDVSGINNLGDIVGYYVDANNTRHGFLTTVPEPTTMLLPGLGLVGLAGVRRKFKS